MTKISPELVEAAAKAICKSVSFGKSVGTWHTPGMLMMSEAALSAALPILRREILFDLRALGGDYPWLSSYAKAHGLDLDD